VPPYDPLIASLLIGAAAFLSLRDALRDERKMARLAKAWLRARAFFRETGGRRRG
jgi:hypothetical protein